MEAVAKWVSIRNGETTLDGKPADENNISDRLPEFWLETQPMVYIGMTEKQC
jgi:hypothetical protein